MTKIKQLFASWNNPKGNADTERVMRTIKEDLACPREWDFPFELERALKLWIHNYNTDYPHSSLGYLIPEQFEQKHQRIISSTLVQPKTERSPTLFVH